MSSTEGQVVRDDSSRGEEVLGELLKAVFLMPATVANSVLLRRFRQPLSSVVGFTAVAEVVLYVAWLIAGGAPRVVAMPSSLQLSTVVPLLVIAYLMVSLALTPLLTYSEIRALRRDPHQLKLNNGKWTYNFSFARTPWKTLTKRRKIRALAAGIFHEDRTSLGLENMAYGRGKVFDALPTTNDRITSRYVEEAITHTLVFGGSGSGKSVTMLQLIRGDMLNNRSLVVIDFKGDPKVSQKLADWSNELDFNFFHFSPSSRYTVRGGNQCFWDPFAMADESSRPSRIEDLRVWDNASEHYRTTWDTISSTIFKFLDRVKQTGSARTKLPQVAWGQGQLKEFQSAISGGENSLLALSTALNGTELAQEASTFLTTAKTESLYRSELKGIANRLRALDNKGYGRWMTASGDPARDINLDSLLAVDGNVILFTLDAKNAPKEVGGLGAMLLAELDAVSSKRGGRATNPVGIYVDEAQNVVPEKLLQLFTMARSSKMALTIVQQSLAQFEATSASGKTFRQLLFDTIDNFIVHAGSTFTTGEIFSDILGKKSVSKVHGTSQGGGISGGMGYQDEDDWVINPSVFVALQKPEDGTFTRGGEPTVAGSAEAVVINKRTHDTYFKKRSKGPLARKVWMIPSPEVRVDVEVSDEEQRVPEAPQPRTVADSAPVPQLQPMVRVTVKQPPAQTQAPAAPRVVFTKDEEANSAASRALPDTSRAVGWDALPPLPNRSLGRAYNLLDDEEES